MDDVSIASFPTPTVYETQPHWEEKDVETRMDGIPSEEKEGGKKGRERSTSADDASKHRGDRSRENSKRTNDRIPKCKDHRMHECMGKNTTPKQTMATTTHVHLLPSIGVRNHPSDTKSNRQTMRRFHGKSNAQPLPWVPCSIERWKHNTS